MAIGAIVLCSGGIDSTTTLAIAKNNGYDLYALSFLYGQRHAVEIIAAKRVSSYFKVRNHFILEIDLTKIGGSALTDAIDVPKDRVLDIPSERIPSTYVPARNTIFLSFALAWAEILDVSDIFIGVNVRDYSGYPDCRPEYIQAFETMANLGTRAGAEGKRMHIRAPLMKMTKDEIIRTGIRLGVDYSMTHSCYDPTPAGRACGHCDSCLLRKRGFSKSGISDPAQYQYD